MPTPTVRYTAVVHIEEVTEVAAHKDYSTNVPATKESRELTKLVIRADTLGKLQSKLTAHISLIEG